MPATGPDHKLGWVGAAVWTADPPWWTFLPAWPAAAGPTRDWPHCLFLKELVGLPSGSRRSLRWPWPGGGFPRGSGATTQNRGTGAAGPAPTGELTSGQEVNQGPGTGRACFHQLAPSRTGPDGACPPRLLVSCTSLRAPSCAQLWVPPRGAHWCDGRGSSPWVLSRHFLQSGRGPVTSPTTMDRLSCRGEVTLSGGN